MAKQLIHTSEFYNHSDNLGNLAFTFHTFNKGRIPETAYGSTQVKIPVPYFVVFYNGSGNAPEQYELRLSDAFEKKVEDPQIELICKVYNINTGNNAQIMEKCPTLREYMYFVDLVRKNFEENGYEDLEQAIEQAINECIQKNVLKEFLKENRSEVTKVMQLDYTFERQLELEREAAASEAWEQGIQHGLEQERLAMIRKMLAQGYDKQFIMQFGYTEEEYQKSMKK